VKITALKRRVKMWQRRAALMDFDIRVSVKDGLHIGKIYCHAATQVIDQRVTMEFNADLLPDTSADELDFIICHELQHVLYNPQDELWEKFFGVTRLGKPGLLAAEWGDAVEKQCDHQATVLVNAYRRKRDRHSK